MSKKKDLMKTIWVAAMLCLSFLMIFPLLFMISTSLKTNGDYFTLIPKQWQFSNYSEVLRQGEWGIYFRNSLLITVTSVVISLLLNSLAGYAFARLKFRGSNILFGIMLLGLMLPQQLTLLPTFLMLVRFPLAGGNNLFGQGGTGLYDTYIGILLPIISGSFGVFFCKQFFDTFPTELDDAVKIDGANRWQAYVHIYIPNAKPLFATLGLTKFVSTWNNYLWPLIMTQGDSMRTVQLALTRFQQEDQIQWNFLMAGTTMVAIPVMVVFLFCQKYFIEGNISAGIK